MSKFKEFSRSFHGLHAIFFNKKTIIFPEPQIFLAFPEIEPEIFLKFS